MRNKLNGKRGWGLLNCLRVVYLLKIIFIDYNQVVENNEEDNDGHHDDSDDLFSENYRVKNRGKGKAISTDQGPILSPQKQGSGGDT